MRLDNIQVIARREYLQRVKTKGFWIATVVLPLFAVAMTVLPSLFMARGGSAHRVIVVDAIGGITPELARPLPSETVDPRMKTELVFTPEAPAADADAQRAALDRRVLEKEADAWIWIGREALQDAKVEYHARSVSNVVTQRILERRISQAVRRIRLAEAGFDADRVGALSAPVELKTARVSKEGSRDEGQMGGFIFAYVLFFILFLGLLVWGQQVMTGVLEEKSSRVIEVLISSIKPFDLMMGKLTGICLVGLTQFGVWLLTLVILTTPGLLSMTALPADLQLPAFSAANALHFALFFILGFFVFSSFYAALGAAFNNLQEAQQVAGTLGFLFTVPAILMPMVINDPSSTLSVVTSLIPLFTPVLMPMRIVVETPPAWQIGLGYLLTVGLLLFMVWACGRIYRVGILMYGKKPTLPEMWRWLRYS